MFQIMVFILYTPEFLIILRRLQMFWINLFPKSAQEYSVLLSFSLLLTSMIYKKGDTQLKLDSLEYNGPPHFSLSEIFGIDKAYKCVTWFIFLKNSLLALWGQTFQIVLWIYGCI